MQAAFIVIDENRGGDMHGIAQQQAFLDAGFTQTILNLRLNVNYFSALGDVEP